MSKEKNSKKTPKEDTVEIVFIDPKTNKPWDNNEDPVILSKSEYDDIVKAAELGGLTVEEFFVEAIKALVSKNEEDSQD